MKKIDISKDLMDIMLIKYCGEYFTHTGPSKNGIVFTQFQSMSENIDPNGGFHCLVKAIQSLRDDDDDFVATPPKKRINIEGDKLKYF